MLLHQLALSVLTITLSYYHVQFDLRKAGCSTTTCEHKLISENKLLNLLSIMTMKM